MTRVSADILEELNLTESQAEMLWALHSGTSPKPMRELARQLRCDPSNITLMTDRLVAVGLVERQPHPTDGRQRVLALTDKGVKVWTLLMDRLQERAPVFTLSAEERAVLLALLEKAHARPTLI
jgi:DNA-binding MarR family transcriptional regulator